MQDDSLGGQACSSSPTYTDDLTNVSQLSGFIQNVTNQQVGGYQVSGAQYATTLQVVN
jgi:hypothetical protein